MDADKKRIEREVKQKEYEARILVWQPLQNTILACNQLWNQLEIERVFSDVATYVFGARLDFPDLPKNEPGTCRVFDNPSNCVILQDKKNNEILLLQEDGKWEACSAKEGVLAEYYQSVNDRLVSNVEIKQCLAVLQEKRDLKPTDLRFSHIGRTIRKPLRGRDEDGAYTIWQSKGELAMNFNSIKSDFFGVNIPLREVDSPGRLEIMLDDFYARRHR